MDSLKKTVNILLVDDLPANLLALEVILEPLGENLIRAASGAAALAIAREAVFAAVLIDVRMPGMDGFETAIQLRKLPGHAATPILFITADHDGAAHAREAYALGAVDFLPKPIVPEVLRAKVSVFVDLFRSKEQLREKTVFLEAVLESVSDAIVACDADGNLTLFNEASRRLHGLSQEFLPSSAWAAQYQLDGADGKARIQPEDVPLYRALRGERVCDMELALANPGGTRRHVVANGATLRAEDGRKLGAVVSLRDVTSERQAAAAMAESAAEQARRKQAEEMAERLRQSEAKMRLLADQLALTDRRKTEFLAVLAHELRNPLAPIRAGLTLMVSGLTGDRLRATVQMMQRQLDHVVHLVDDLMDVARIANGKIELKRETLALKPIVELAVEATLPLIRTREHSLSLCLPNEDVLVDVDPVRLTQVLSNLLSNAAKYSPPKGAIRLEVQPHASQVALTVADTGMGIPADSLQHIFDPFAQLGLHQEASPGGLGIGLSLSRQLIELHGGTIAAESAGPGKGSTFTVTLPLAAAAAAVAPIGQRKPSSAVAPRRVLVVDDNLDAATTMGSLLELDGHTVALAHTGADALALAQEFRPDVAFVDIGMPGMNGYETAIAMRQVAELAQIRLVALTGWGGEADCERSRAAGFDCHLTKPAAPDEINSALATALGDVS